MSDEHEVISGVPQAQGTVLAFILFIIMISDIDDNLRNRINRLFADDTKVSAKIRTFDDRVASTRSKYNLQMGR